MLRAPAFSLKRAVHLGDLKAQVVFVTRKYGRFLYEDSIKGAKESARLRSERAEEPVREVIEHDDGTVTYIHVTYALHRMGAYRTFVPLDILDYPIVLKFDNCVDDGVADDLPAVTGALKDVKSKVLRDAASGSQYDENGIPAKLVIQAADLGDDSFRLRLAWWTKYLDERLDDNRDARRRAFCDGGSDIESIAEDPAIDDSALRSMLDGISLSASASFDPDFALVDLIDAIEDVLSDVPEEQAEIFRRHFFGEEDYKDIAQSLGKACSSMTYAMGKLLPLLRERLEELGY